MKERTLFIFATTFLLTTATYAKYAKVLLVRGSVTQLAPGELLARKVKKEEILKIDTSILTGDNSIVRLSLEDGSVLSLGPNSKIVLNEISKTEQGKSVISLLKGSIRNKIKKRDDGGMHFFIKTKTAAMGVRGTEFEAVYGKESGVTSLLTYKGTVSMAHKKEVDRLNKKEYSQVEYSRDSDLDQSLIIEKYNEKKTVSPSIDDMEEALNEGRSSTVRAGQLSQTVDSFDSVGQPVLIHPVQLNLLYKNSSYEQMVTKGDLANLDSGHGVIKSVATQTPPEGLYDEEAKVYAPKSGGFFDRKSGVYIAPSKDALFDQERQIFVDKDMGSIDAKTGEYIAPFGLEIDPVRGFIKKKFKKNTPKDLIAKVERNQQRLNSSLGQSIVVGAGASELKSEEKYFLSYRELISKNVISMSFGGYNQNFKMKNSSLNKNDNYDNHLALRAKLGLDFDSGSKLSPFVNFTFSYNDFIVDNTELLQSGSKLTSMGGGVKYSLAPHWNLLGQIKLDQEFFIMYENNDNIISSSFDRFTVPKVMFGIQGEWFRYKKLSGELEAQLGTNFSKSAGDTSVSMGLLYSLKLGFRYWPSKSWYLTSFLFRDHDTYNVSGSSYVYDYDAGRSTTGLNLGLGSYF